MVEVDDIYPQNNLRIVEGDATARMLKPGLYDFNLRQQEARVFDGQAVVQDGDKQIKLKGGHELADRPMRPRKRRGSRRKPTKPAIFITGAVCVRLIWQRPT